MVDFSRELQILKKIQEILRKANDVNNLLPNARLIENDNFLRYVNNKLSNYIWKIENNILEVAFVGLEKAGKSTFANAFIGKELLPSKRERATYIPTEVRYSENGRVEVEFYSEKEFLKVFRSMLKDVEYPNWKNVTLDNISVESFKKYFHSLEKKNKALYERHKNRLENDILEILQQKENIKKFLTGETEVFKEDKIENYMKFIIDPHLSRAVRKVLIYSPKLKGLENVVIYDLPGFDSPTFSHISYTIDFLKRADAIVFVREADKPSLRGPEVDILQKTKEDDGLPIKLKLFYFLNKADVLESEKEVSDIIQKFIDELKKYDLFLDENRIFLGSAKVFFEKDKENSPIWKKIKSLGLKDDGINAIKQALIEYNLKERRKLLKIRVHQFLQNELLYLLKNIKEKTTYLNQNIDAVAISLEEVKRIYFRLSETLPEQLEYLINQFKQNIEEQQPLTSKLKEKIPSIIQFPDEDTVQKIIYKIKSEDYTVTNLVPSSLNRAIRDYLKNQIRTNYSRIILSSLEEKIKEVENSFIDLIIENFENIVDISDTDNLRKAFKNFVDNHLAVYSFADRSLKALVERFSGDLIDITMIPLTDIDREEKFKASFRDFISLAAYDENFDLSKPLLENSLIYKLLTQQDKQNLFGNIDDILKELKDYFGDVILSTIPYGQLVALIWKLKKQGQKIDEIIEFFEQKVSSIKGKIKSKKELQTSNYDNINSLDFLFQIRESLEQPKNYEEVKEEIQRDLEILRELLSSTVLRAIHAEKAYIIATVNYGNALKNLVTSEKFFDFIKNHRHLLLGSKYQKIEEWKKYKPLLEDLEENINLVEKQILQF